ncbi:hypothetical protein B0A48_13485 [Cryoendolithus antarcticus]|uniref:Uncharacterized protein n=1 Tax=Cryoendolithus antarcticus TaxID=1507870 RepID=A0A1V8SP38_9PEZI|nr:hypothetical protein B0A48_13485 [Cryoendolithus antarcticus]
MSQDLFAAFGNEDVATKHAQPKSEWDALGPSAARLIPQAEVLPALDRSDDEDDFGDFEDAAKETPLPVKSSNTIQISVSKDSAPVPLNMKASTATAAQTKPAPRATQKSEARSTPPKPLPLKPKPVTQDKPKTGAHPFAGHMDFLFSADDDEYDAGADDLTVDLANDPEAAMAYSKKLIAAQMAAESESKATAPLPPSPKAQLKPPPRSPNKLRKKSQYAPPKDHSVFFDAENVNAEEPGADAKEDEDWGDFETVAAVDRSDQGKSTVAPQPLFRERPLPTMDLLSLDESPPPSMTAEHVPPHLSKFDSSTTPDTTEEVDAWDDFESATPEPTQKISRVPFISSPTEHTSTPATLPLPSANALPPNNVPPPSLLLSLFPPLIASAQSTLLLPLSKLPASDKETLLHHPATFAFLQTYLSHSTALAHVLAGRKLRWKRDQRLAQSMRIGSAGKQGGMKLTGVDKGELAKEEREVLDVMRLWGAQAGRLRSAVTAVNTSSLGSQKLPATPEIADAMPIKTLKSAEGGFIAALTCALCGLKREERVAKMDERIADSFGEWWVEGAGMHLTCWRFWEEMKGKLKER